MLIVSNSGSTGEGMSVAAVIDPQRQWKLSPVDLAVLDRWDDYTQAKEAMFQRTDTPAAP
jgi:polyphosphate kinase 2 (PPK2 family)